MHNSVTLWVFPVHSSELCQDSSLPSFLTLLWSSFGSANFKLSQRLSHPKIIISDSSVSMNLFSSSCTVSLPLCFWILSHYVDWTRGSPVFHIYSTLGWWKLISRFFLLLIGYTSIRHFSGRSSPEFNTLLKFFFIHLQPTFIYIDFFHSPVYLQFFIFTYTK